METTAAALANPYGAELVALHSVKVSALMKAKAADLNNFERTIRNAARGAKRQARTLYVGRTATGYHINADATALPVVDYAAEADGTLTVYRGGGNAYSVR